MSLTSDCKTGTYAHAFLFSNYYFPYYNIISHFIKALYIYVCVCAAWPRM